MDNLVWIYGSLMSLDSLMATLAPGTRLPGAETARVHGWQRAWNCVSAKTFIRPGDVSRVRRVVMGIEAVPGSWSSGVIVQISDQDMARLRLREAAYDEVDITSALDLPSGRVVTFVPKEAVRRSVCSTEEQLVVERDYLDLCLKGAATFGLDEAIVEIEDALDLDVVTGAGSVEFRPII